MPPARNAVSDWLSSSQQAQQMPAPQNGANAISREDAALKPAPLNIGKQTGQFDTPSVRHKVRKWQAEGGGITTDTDVITVEYEEEEKAPKKEKQTPKAKPSKDKIAAGVDAEVPQTSPTKARSPPKTGAARMRTQREMNAEKQAWVRKKSKPRNDILEEEIKHVGTPKKRVVSDGHWRKDRSPPKKDEPPLNTPKYTVKRTTIRPGDGSMASDKAVPDPDDDGIRVRPLRVDKPKSDMDDDGIRVRPLKIRPRTRSHSRERTRTSPATRIDSGRSEDAKDAYVRTPRTSGKENRTVSYEQGDDDFLHDRKQRTRRRRHDSPPLSDFDTDTIAGQSVAPDDSISKINGKAPRRTRSPIYDERPLKERASARLRKAEKTTPQKPVDSPTITPPKVYGNRIEAWLDHAPDPFVEGDDTPRTDSRERDVSSEQRRPNTGDSDRKRSSRFSPAAGSVYDGQATEKRSPTEQGREKSARKSDHEDSISTVSSSAPPTELPPISTSKHSPGVNLRRRFPTTGKPLSTIASVNTLRSSTPSEVSDQGTVVPDARDRETGNPTGLKRRLTRHDDLLSVLSLPRAGSKSITSARSIRTSRTRLDKATVQDLWGEFAADETKYQRELRTLVDGVIPVLLSCVLSKSDSSVAAGLFGRTTNGVAITQPIIDMGVALERLKSHHRRAPQTDMNALVTWAQGAVKIYTDYIKAWRMGFQDVVVNLAPADENIKKEPGWDEGLPRNQDGDLVNGDGERVDVAFLLKRPLVRLKYLSKTFKVRLRCDSTVQYAYTGNLGYESSRTITARCRNGRQIPTTGHRRTQKVERRASETRRRSSSKY